MNPVPGRVSSRRRWCSFLLCKKRAHRRDWAKTTHSNSSCGGGASTCRAGQNRRRYTSRNVFISKVEIKTCWPRHVRRAALPQLEAHYFGNKPAPAVKERRSALSRCALKKLAVTLKGKVSSQNRDHVLLLWPAFNHIRRGGLVSTEKNLT